MHSIPNATGWVRKIAVSLPALAVILTVGACSTADNQTTQPTPVAAIDSGSDEAQGGNLLSDHRAHRRGFFPLRIGNRWTYHGSFLTRIEGDSVAMIELFGEQRELTETEALFGRTYVVEEQKRWNRLIPPPPPDSTTFWVRYRQDKAGLYEADVPLAQPPGALLAVSAQASKSGQPQDVGVLANWDQLETRVVAVKGAAYLPAVRKLKHKLQTVQAALRYAGLKLRTRSGGPPGGVLPDELTRLKYPLHPGQEWTIRADPFFTSRVERHEVLDLPAGRMPAYRIRILIEGLDPLDEIFIWYGRKGFLKMRYHVVSVATDPEGNPIGTLISEEHIELESLKLVR